MLLLQEPGHAAWRSRLPSQAIALIDPISVVEAAASGHFVMSSAQDVRVFVILGHEFARCVPNDQPTYVQLLYGLIRTRVEVEQLLVAASGGLLHKR